MTGHDQKASILPQKDEEHGTAEHRGGERQHDTEACRCKDVSEMKPRDLLGLMFRDLAFWKKTDKK